MFIEVVVFTDLIAPGKARLPDQKSNVQTIVGGEGDSYRRNPGEGARRMNWPSKYFIEVRLG